MATNAAGPGPATAIEERVGPKQLQTTFEKAGAAPFWQDPSPPFLQVGIDTPSVSGYEVPSRRIKVSSLCLPPVARA